MKNILEEINNRLGDTKECISDLKYHPSRTAKTKRTLG